MGSSSSKNKVSEEEKYHLDTNDKYIYSSAYPRNDVGFAFELIDKRKLGYAIYGQKENYKVTVILFPGAPGTRLFNHESHDKINIAYGVRMIVLDRPGVGLSSTHKNWTFKTYANDVYQLIKYLKLNTYHIIAYSAGGPFACSYCSLYSQDIEYKIKSYTLIAGVGPPNTPKVYGQMTFINKIGWFIVLNTNQSVIDLAASTAENKDKPIKSLIDDFGKGDYDKEMIKDPSIIKSFLYSKYEEEAIDETRTDKDKNDKPGNRLLLLYGTPWDIKMKNIKCPLYIYNGNMDYSCVPNMAKFMFQSITGKKPPSLTQDIIESMEETEKETEQQNQYKSVISTPVKINNNNEDQEQDEKEEKKETEIEAILDIDESILDQFEKEYLDNQQLNDNDINNKQSKLIWGKGKGHLWYFEQDLWREIIFRTIFLEQK